MVSVTTSVSAIESENIQSWLDRLVPQHSSAEMASVRQACEQAATLYAGQHALTGTPLLQHALGAASILAEMRLDVDTIIAAILHAAPNYLAKDDRTLEQQFGADVTTLVAGCMRVESIREFSELHAPQSKKKDAAAQQMENLRKLLLAMVEDIRVVLIKLAERTQTMRTLSGASPEEQQVVAREAQRIYAPLANRLGVWQLKWELEDLSLRYLEPDLYKKIARLLDERRAEREQYIHDVVILLKTELERAGIAAEVAGRPKHIYSIVNKMKRKGVEFGELYDVRAVRILVKDVEECYAALSLVHELWPPIAGEFDDYIAKPKSNDYRSLHTAVSGPRGLALEVQIRTHEMHHHSELGVAAHWRYKEGGKADARLNEQIAWLRQILAWKDEMAERGELQQQFGSELFQDRVYVLTPQGKVVDLAQGSTPVDFAYAVHTGLGHRTRGAKVDDHIVPLNYKLLNGQRVEIMAARQGGPSRDWLNPELGFLQSSRARAKVRHWFNEQNFESDVAQGRVLLERELQRLGMTATNQEQLAQQMHFNRLEELLAGMGRNEVTPRQVAQVLQQERQEEKQEPVLVAKPGKAQSSAPGITVEGMGNLQTRMALCCNPMPPDDIVGFITRDRGITIHRRDCAAMLRLPEENRGRMLAAQWGVHRGAVFAATLEVEAMDRQGLLRDIGDLFAREHVNVTKVNSQSRTGMAKMRFAIEVSGQEQLGRLQGLLGQVPGVVAVRRV